jgi:AcrR family transcriptional regulator
LVIRHFGSKEGLRRAVNAHVGDTIDALLAEVAAHGAESINPAAAGFLVDAMQSHLDPDSPIPRYLARCVVDGDQSGRDVVSRVMEASRNAWESLAAQGLVEPGDDPRTRAAIVGALDLAVLVLRGPIGDAMGADPLGAEGSVRWTREVARLLSSGLTPTADTNAKEPADG